MKAKKQRQTVKAITEERALKLSNDLSEGIASGTVQEWRGVALCFRKELDRAHADINRIRPSIAAYVAGQHCVTYAHQEMQTWLKSVKS